MKRHKYFIRFLIFWHVFIAAFCLLLFNVRLENYDGDIINIAGEQFTVSLSQKIEIYSLNGYLLLIAAVSFVSGICLLVKKTWGRVFSIILGAVLIPFGVYLFIGNFGFTAIRYTTFLERIVDYFTSMGATLSCIDITAIFYGVFAIIYFTRKNVKKYITLQSGKKENGNENQ